MRRPLLPAWLATAALLTGPALVPASVLAHAIQSELSELSGAAVPHSHPHPHGEGQSGAIHLQLSSAFSTGQPASGAAVRLVPTPGAAPVELGRTDAQGRLAFALPARLGSEAEIQVDAGAGHRDWISVQEVNHLHAAAASGQPRLSLRFTDRPFGGLEASLLSLAPIAGLGLLGGLLLRRRSRG